MSIWTAKLDFLLFFKSYVDLLVGELDSYNGPLIIYMIICSYFIFIESVKNNALKKYVFLLNYSVHRKIF